MVVCRALFAGLSTVFPFPSAIIPTVTTMSSIAASTAFATAISSPISATVSSSTAIPTAVAAAFGIG